MASAYWRRRLRQRRLNGKNGGLSLGAKLLLAAGGLMLAAVIAVVGAGAGVYMYYAQDLVPPEEALADQPSSGAKIYDRNGKLLYQFVDDLAGLRNPVPLSEVSQYLIDATIATEDDTFYSNPGVNIKGLIRAAYENFFPGELGFLQGSGGSSITQQLVKNVYIAPEERTKRSIPRKIKETVFALELTRRASEGLDGGGGVGGLIDLVDFLLTGPDKTSKDQILEWYLNQISYGGLYNGVEAASLGYFGKHAKDLTLAEAALLAGIPASPATYDPVNNPEAALARRSQVLDLMLDEGKISAVEAYAAKLEPLNLAPQRFPIEAPHFVLTYVQPQLEQLVGRDALYRGGLRVTTTLDLDLQRKGEEVLERWISEFEETSNGHNGALVAIDPKTGEILVMIGSRDYFRDDIQGRNNMTIALNSPGSAFKPFAYMTSFMELGWGPGTMILDTPVSFTEADGDVFTPRNPKGDFKGPISIRTALGNSLNVPAFKMAWATGVENIVRVARKMGITSLTGYYGPSITIGGVDVTLLDMVFGYSVFANNGLMRGMPSILDLPEGYRELDPIAILKVEDSEGNVVWEPERSEVQVVPPQYPYLVTDILTDPSAQCATFGCGGITIPGQVAAVKTGTSEPYEDSRAIGDTWAFGYTPALAAGVWAGNADNSPMVNIYSTSISWRAVRDFMVFALEGKPPERVPRPEGIVEATVCVPSGKLPTPYCGKTTTDIFAEGSVPKEKDDWWRPLKIDTRNGLLATARTPRRFVEERVFLVLPEELEGFSREQAEEWARALGVPLAPTEESPLGAETGGILSGPAAISSPDSGSVVSGIMGIIGRADSPDFVSYRLEYGEGTVPSDWSLIKRSTDPVESGLLGVWDTGGLQPGIYTIRLVVVDRKLGQVATSVAVQVAAAGGPDLPETQETEEPARRTPRPAATPHPFRRLMTPTAESGER